MFELGIGWRYVYRRSQSRLLLAALVIATVTALIGIGLTLADQSTGSGSAWKLLPVLAALPAAILGLLYFFSSFTTVSVLGVMLGVAALTMVLSITTGFQQEFRKKVLGVNAHVIIQKQQRHRFSEYRDVGKAALAIDNEVIAEQPFIFVEMLVTRGKGELAGVAIKGVDPDRVSTILDLEQDIIEGSVSSLREARTDKKPAPLILGKELARKIKAKLGDTVKVVAPLSNIDVTTWTTTESTPITREFVVGGIFYSGFEEYDRRLMYISLREAQDMLGRGDRVMGVELKVKDVDRAEEISHKIESFLAQDPKFSKLGPYEVQDWHQLNRNLFTALTLQKIVLLIILTLIIVVATFNTVSALTMMVIDKTREIAIFRSMGARAISISRIFQVVGITIGGIGTALGLGIGLSFCAAVSKYGYALDPKVYLIDRLPISVNVLEVALVGAITMVISFVAILVPSRRAALLRPVEGLRHS